MANDALCLCRFAIASFCWSFLRQQRAINGDDQRPGFDRIVIGQRDIFCHFELGFLAIRCPLSKDNSGTCRVLRGCIAIFAIYGLVGSGLLNNFLRVMAVRKSLAAQFFATSKYYVGYLK